MVGTAAADFDAVFARHYRPLVRTLSAVGPAPHSAEDAVQEAFAQALVRWSRVGSYDDPVAWIRRTAVHRMLNERRRLFRRERALPKLAHDAVSHVAAPDAAEPASPELIAAIRALPLRQRTALVLKVLDDLDTDEVADAMGITPGAVRHHLHEARHTLRNAIGAHDD